MTQLSPTDDPGLLLLACTMYRNTDFQGRQAQALQQTVRAKGQPLFADYFHTTFTYVIRVTPPHV